MKKNNGGIVLFLSVVVTFISLGILFLLSSSAISGKQTVSLDYFRTQLIKNIESGKALINNYDFEDLTDDNQIQIETIESGTITIDRVDKLSSNFRGQRIFASLQRNRLEHFESLSSDFTIAFWIRPNNTVDFNGIRLPHNGEPILGYSKETDGANPASGFRFYFTRAGNVGSLKCTVNFESGSRTISIDNIVDGIWMFVTITYNGSQLKIFKNGAQQNNVINIESTIDWSTIADNQFYFGRNNFSNEFTNGNFFSGMIRNFGVWTASTSNNGVLVMHNEGLNFNPLADLGQYNISNNLHGFWRLNEGTGGFIYDLSIHNNNGSILNRNNQDVCWTTVTDSFRYIISSTLNDFSRSEISR